MCGLMPYINPRLGPCGLAAVLHIVICSAYGVAGNAESKVVVALYRVCRDAVVSATVDGGGWAFGYS